VPGSSNSATIHKYTMTGAYVNSTTLNYTTDAYAISCVNDTVWACPDRYAHIYYGYAASKFAGGSITNDATWDVGSGTNGVGNIAFDGTYYYIAWIGTPGITFKRFYRDRTLDTSGTVSIDSRSVMCTVQVNAHDVGATAILAPVDTVDTGTAVIPRAVVRNFGSSEETFLTRFAIGDDYTDTMTVTVAAGATDTLTFPGWVADSVGTFAVRCSTELAGDENPANDLAADSVLVIAFTGINEERGLTAMFRLGEILPNPTGGLTCIRYGLPAPAAVKLSVYSAAGMLVRTIALGVQNPGWYQTAWDGADFRGRKVGAGVYLIRLEAGMFTSTRKLVVQR
jgi:hypothetical protein